MQPLPGCRPKTLPRFPSLSCPIFTQPLLHMVQHVVDWVASYPHSHHYPPAPLNLLHTPPSPLPLLPSLTCTRVRAIIIITEDSRRTKPNVIVNSTTHYRTILCDLLSNLNKTVWTDYKVFRLRLFSQTTTAIE